MTGRWTVVALLLAGCGRPGATPAREGTVSETHLPSVRVESPAFKDGGEIPREYTCEGRDTPPQLTWEPGPPGTVSYALICEDPDAPRGTWVHWVAWNIAATGLPTAGLEEGRNSWGRTGYGGPCPPSGRHRYVFRVYALSSRLTLPATATKEQLLAALEGKLLAEGALVGTYQKKG